MPAPPGGRLASEGLQTGGEAHRAGAGRGDGMSHFLSRVETALRDPELKMALGRATERLGSRRSASLASLPDSDLLRDMARRAKLGLLGDLAGNLEIFEKNLIK